MMKQVLVSLRPKDGDTSSRGDRAGRGAGTSTACPQPGRRLSRGAEEEWAEAGRATVFVSPWRGRDPRASCLTGSHRLLLLLLARQRSRAEAQRCWLLLLLLLLLLRAAGTWLVALLWKLLLAWSLLSLQTFLLLLLLLPLLLLPGSELLRLFVVTSTGLRSSSRGSMLGIPASFLLPADEPWPEASWTLLHVFPPLTGRASRLCPVFLGTTTCAYGL